VTHPSITVGSSQRSYVLYTPSNYNTAGKQFPLILVFHGDGGDGTGQHNDFGVNQGFEKIAEMNGGAIIVYPDGLNGTWFGSGTASALSQDTAFVDALVSSLVKGGKVASGQVYAAGISRGAYFINNMVLQSSTIWKGIAIHSGSNAGVNVTWNSHWTVDGKDFWYPSGPNHYNQPLAMLQVHGMSDNTPGVSYSDAQFARDTWRAANTCDDTAVPKTYSYDPSPCVTYRGCSKPVGWCAIPGMGHQWWNAPSATAGVSQAAYVTWKFFSEQK